MSCFTSSRQAFLRVLSYSIRQMPRGTQCNQLTAVWSSSVLKLSQNTMERCTAAFLNAVTTLLSATAVFFSYGVCKMFQKAPFQARIYNLLPPSAIFKLKIHQNAFVAGASLAGFRGVLHGMEGKGT